MSTTIFNGATSGVVYNGGTPDGSQFATPFSFGGEQIQQIVGTNAELRVKFTGTQCELRIYGDGHTWTWTIDGGGTQTASPSGSTMQWLTVATGLSDTTHTLVVKPMGNYIGWDSILRVTGASPAISAPTGYTNPQFGFTASGVTRDNSQYRTGSVEGYVGVTDHGSCRFKATTSEIKIWNRYDSNSPIGLVIDDDITTLVRQNPSSGWGWTTFSGLDGTAEHSYRFIIPGGVYFYNFMAAGLNTTALTPYPADYWQGDSITASSNIANGDAAPNYHIYYAIKAKRGWQIEALAGATASSQGISWDTHPGTASPTPDRVILAWGRNDIGESSPTWTSAITTIITQIHSDLPTKKLVWLGIFDTSSTVSTRGPYNTDLSNTITAFSNSLVTYFSTDGTGVVSTSDGTHPDAAGAATIGAYLFNNLDGLPSLNLSGAGSVTITGTATASVLGQMAGAGTVPITGTGTATALLQMAGAGSVLITGTATASVKNQMAGAGTVNVSGSGTASLLAQMAGAGAVTISGSGSITTNNALNINGAGTVLITGSAAATVIATASGAGTVPITGTGTASGLLQMAGAGAVLITGSASVTTGNTLNANAAGTVPITGTGTISVVSTANGAGTVPVSGSGTISTTNATLNINSAGIVPILGSGTISVVSTINASGNVLIAGSGFIHNGPLGTDTTVYVFYLGV